LAAFTGGSDVRRDLKTLHAGADLVVGTPGRLVDLLERGSLQLGAVHSVVLDEADEMLDMGFREDLETLLGAASARTRTMMFSATLPPPILSLASRYQKNAFRVDVRPPADDDAHQDIEYLAHLTAIGDHLPAVVNVLRHNAGGKAIVFGTTREGVASLHQELVRRGFSAVVLSGDRAQAERTRALEALRSGDAQILVATNVAARGLDLPEVDLVVHADLPLNTESLTHRSGRTGRAGRKGRSVVIANLAERRKAERLMAGARVRFTWTEAPSAAVIAQDAQSRLEEELLQATQPEAVIPETVQALADRLITKADAQRVLAALLARELSRLPQGERMKPVRITAPGGVPDRFPQSGPRESRSDFSRDAVVFRINLGAHSKAEPGWLLPLLCRRGGITRSEVGAIRIGPRHSEFEIAGRAAGDFALAASQPDPRAPHVVIERVSGSASRGKRKPDNHHSRSERPWEIRSEARSEARSDTPPPHGADSHPKAAHKAAIERGADSHPKAAHKAAIERGADSHPKAAHKASIERGADSHPKAAMERPAGRKPFFSDRAEVPVRRKPFASTGDAPTRRKPFVAGAPGSGGFAPARRKAGPSFAESRADHAGGSPHKPRPGHAPLSKRGSEGRPTFGKAAPAWKARPRPSKKGT
jgi:ATP-dependent RNA helicase DeaD